MLAFGIISVAVWLIIAAVIYWFGGESMSDIPLLIGTIILAPLMAAGTMFYYRFIFLGGRGEAIETKAMRRRRKREEAAKRSASNAAAQASSGPDRRSAEPRGDRES